MIGLTPRRGVAKPRKGWLRSFPARLASGTLRCTGGAWEKRAGSEYARTFAPSRRAWLELGDVVVVIGADVAAVELAGVARAGFFETWRVRIVHGNAVDGDVQVMPIAFRRAAKERR